MGKNNKTDTTDPCPPVYSREEKLDKFERIYAKALDTILDSLGKDKDSVYGACKAIECASREIGTIERVMRLVGESTGTTRTVIGYEVTEDAAELDRLFASDPVHA